MATGTEVPAYYDPMLAKLIVHGDTRETALARLSDALARTRLHGIATNLDYLRQIVADARFAAGSCPPASWKPSSTGPRRSRCWRPAPTPACRIIRVGPAMGYRRAAVRSDGRLRVPAGQPHRRQRAGRRRHREATLAGPTLRFHGDAVIALTGAQCAATLDGAPVPMWRPVAVRAGQVLATGRALSGCRMYLAVRDGLDVPVYLGSRSTFALGQFGGHAGRTLRVGDMLPRVRPELPGAPAAPRPNRRPRRPSWCRPMAIPGASACSTGRMARRTSSSRRPSTPSSPPTGKSTTTPSPGRAPDRPQAGLGARSGGEAGLHPSNIHDCEYAIGSINFTGDSP